MGQRGQTCRNTRERRASDLDTLEIEIHTGAVTLRRRGALVQTLTGTAADAIRAAIDDPIALRRVLARTGRPRR